MYRSCNVINFHFLLSLCFARHGASLGTPCVWQLFLDVFWDCALQSFYVTFLRSSFSCFNLSFLKYRLGFISTQNRVVVLSRQGK